MKLREEGLSISPTDLSYFLSCRHRTALELSVAHGKRTRPEWKDPLLEALFALGLQHERDYVERLRVTSGQLVDLGEEKDREAAVRRTDDAMRAGVDVIVQAALSNGRWYGRPDILLKIDRSSPRLGAWSYEAADTKLARETRGGTILQLGVYSELIEAAQDLAPERFHVVTPSDGDGASGARQVVRTYRFDDYAAYFRLLKASLEDAVAQGYEALEAANYPDPVDHCDICPWILGCRDRRRADDHLSLVAGISRLQRRELESRDIRTMAALAVIGAPLPFRPRRGAAETYERMRDQARLQVRSRDEGHIVYELIPISTRTEMSPPEIDGLARLPEPSPGDVFLDLEGDALAGDHGREYLFGIVTVDQDGSERYQAWWGDTPQAERQAFEAIVDFIVARRAAWPAMHVFHYAPYEPSALKRLMGRYATREREIDECLRGRRFVDLYAVVRQGIRAGVERYSIKNLEPLYDFTRSVDLRQANWALRVMEQAIELDRPGIATPQVRAIVEGYNRDDCVSTRRLRDWLEARRAELIGAGATFGRPPLEPLEASQELDDKAKAVEALRLKLLEGIPPVREDRSADEQARYQLAYILDWHRREDKAEWWEYFRLCELPEDDLLEEPRALAGLAFVANIGQVRRSVVQRYSFPEQEFDIRLSDELKTQDGKVFPSEIVEIDRDARTIDLVVGLKKAELHPSALFAHKYFPKKDIEAALFALGERAAAAGGIQALPPSPERALLLRERPALRAATFSPPPADAGSAVGDYAVSVVTELDRTVLAIQGPPGSGKTYTGARMICSLLEQGMKVGVVGPSHKVVRNLLDAVRDNPEACRRGVDVRLGHKDKDGGEISLTDSGGVMPLDTNEAARAALATGAVNVLGGTAWLWSRPEFEQSVDVLFVDEAGQMSLANVLGIARAAASIVLLGDPQQLDQPTKGSHPDGVDVSALQYILGEARTMPEGHGLFLPITWRLAPAICGFTSELFYSGQLNPKAGLERQALAGTGRIGTGTLDGSGLWVQAVMHDGNRTASDEEARAVVAIVDALLVPGSRWIDEEGGEHSLTAGDICIVAPFNAHVSRIKEAFELRTWNSALPRIGTVDKFQGQEAPVVIYSMATSRPEDAPRGMEFLYSLNRLNVATSRAQCAVIVVASPALFAPLCSTPRQMQLANALCRYRELARVLTAG